MFDRADYEALRERQAQDRPIPELRLLQQSAVAADILTKDDKWDIYLQMLQTQIDQAESSRQSFMAILLDYATVNQEQREYVHRLYIQAQERVMALTYAQSLPKQIMEEVQQIEGMRKIKLVF